MYCLTIIINILFLNCYCLYSKMRSPTQIGEDPDLQIGDSSSGITDSLIISDNESENKQIQTSNKAMQILDELSDIQPINRIDPKMDVIESLTEVEHQSTIENCQRDYSQHCPLQFTHQSLDDGSHKCVFPKYYSGPCLGQELIYKEMGKDEKIQWSKNCMANWPCVSCKRNYSVYCPGDWERVGGGFECRSINSYSGPCKDEKYNFIDYNIAMQKEWSRTCKSYWPCSA